MEEQPRPVLKLSLAALLVIGGIATLAPADVRDEMIGRYRLSLASPRLFELEPDPLAKLPQGAGIVRPVAMTTEPSESDTVHNRFVNTTTGALHFTFQLAFIGQGMPIRMDATYDSIADESVPEEFGAWDSPDLGLNWFMTYGDVIRDAGDSGPNGENRVVLLDDEGRFTFFIETTPDQYHRESVVASPHLSLTRVSDDEFEERHSSGVLKTYQRLVPENDEWVLVRVEDELGNSVVVGRTQGLITSIANNDGATVTLVRPELQGGPPGPSSLRVHNVIPSVGTPVTLGYTGTRVTALTKAGVYSYTFVYAYGMEELRILVLKNAGQLVFRVDDYVGLGVEALTTPGGTTQFDYHPELSKTYVTDHLNHTWKFQYDALGRTVAVIDPAGHTVSRTFDGNGNIASFTDAKGASWSYQYDGDGRLVRETNPLGQFAQFAYNADGNLTSHTSPGGGVTTFEYDPQGRLIRETDPVGVAWETTYNQDNLPATVKIPQGPQYSFGYDSYGRTNLYTGPSGSQLQVTRDGMGRPSVIQRPGGSIFEKSYSASGVPILIRDPEGHETTRTLDNRGRVSTFTDEVGSTRTTTYDTSNRIWKITDALARITTYAYDQNDRLVSTTDADGKVTTFGYDSRGLLTSVTDPLSRTTQYEYDQNRNLTRRIFPNGRQMTFTRYDALNRITGRTFPDGTSDTYAYDANGNVTSLNGPGGQIQVVYNAANQPTSISYPQHNATVTYEYNNWGLRSRMVLPGGDEATYQYNLAGRLEALATPEGSYAFGYDSASNELTSVTYPNGHVVSLSYDSNGHVLTREEHDDLGEVLSRISFVLDPHGRVLQSTDPEGNTTTYTYL